MTEPEAALQEAVNRVRSHTTDHVEQFTILDRMVSLIETEKLMRLMEQMYRDDSLMKQLFRESPWVQRIRARESQKWRAEGIQQGLEQGREEGLEQGREEGLEQGFLEGKRTTILDIIITKFNPPIAQYRTLEKMISATTNASDLQIILMTILSTQTFDAALHELGLDHGATNDSASL